MRHAVTASATPTVAPAIQAVAIYGISEYFNFIP
jgi:hypothetical protein